jgi:hypothetical protein
LPLAPSTLPGGKSARYAFLLPQGKLCSAKMLLAAYMPPLRISIRGKSPPDHPFCRISGTFMMSGILHSHKEFYEPVFFL